jgi:hypothetical protein
LRVLSLLVPTGSALAATLAYLYTIVRNIHPTGGYVSGITIQMIVNGKMFFSELNKVGSGSGANRGDGFVHKAVCLGGSSRIGAIYANKPPAP